MFVYQCPETRAAPINPNNTTASTTATICGLSARPRQRLTDVNSLRGANAICSAFSAGQTATHSIHPVHSTDLICTSLSTGRCDGQALLHLPQSMHASASRRIFTGLSADTIPINAPYGQRNRHQKFWIITRSEE